MWDVGCRMWALLLLGCMTVSCASGPQSSRAPWAAAPLKAADIPRVYGEQWRGAENRSTCALFAFSNLGEGASAIPRGATFSGGWAVAYDLPGTRSAFGIAGTGVRAADSTYKDWPFTRRWPDGSLAEYGPEGGSGPNQLAYLRIADQGCLYNVWSRLGREHLEHLLDATRRVELQ